MLGKIEIITNQQSPVNFFSELGVEWDPAVLNTLTEIQFIQYNEKFWRDTNNYFVGGSAEPQVLGHFDYLPAFHPFNTPAYSTSQAGNVFC